MEGPKQEISFVSKEKTYFTKEQTVFLKEQVEEMENQALLEDDFVGKPYPVEFVNKKKKYVQELEDTHTLKDSIADKKSELYEQETLSPEYRKVSDYLEALFYNKLGGEKGWIPGAIIWKTSKYDDYVNGVDFIVEAQNREFALATDITFSSTKGLKEKLDTIKNQIRANELKKLTFYESLDKENNLLPKVIISVEHEKVVRALKFWADGQGDLLDNHPIKMKTLLELEAQLEAFAFYAKSLGKREIAAAYNDTLAQIQRMIVGHETMLIKYKNLIDDDESYKMIISYCELLKQSLPNANS